MRRSSTSRSANWLSREIARKFRAFALPSLTFRRFSNLCLSATAVCSSLNYTSNIISDFSFLFLKVCFKLKIWRPEYTWTYSEAVPAWIQWEIPVPLIATVIPRWQILLSPLWRHVLSPMPRWLIPMHIFLSQHVHTVRIQLMQIDIFQVCRSSWLLFANCLVDFNYFYYHIIKCMG